MSTTLIENLPSLPRAVDGQAFDNRFIDEPELLTRIPVSSRALANWRKRGKIPYVRLGRRVLYDWSLVRASLLRG